MILAAGRGERMRPLTDHCPKPLLEVRGKPLMQYHLEALGRGGIRDLVVNIAWLGQQIEDRLAPLTKAAAGGACGGAEPLRIRYSDEGRDFGGALETAGGVARALPLLDDAFWLVGGDVYVPQFEFSRAALDRFAAGNALAHLFLIPNPPHNPKGDFGLLPGGIALSHDAVQYTYSTIGLYRKDLFASLPAGNPQGLKAPLAPLLRAAMDNRQVTAEIYPGPWTDVGTPERLAQLNAT
jgi:N-acetyl-alpha-D-muramate 1-phosphate uridylyltransferase